FHMGWPKFVENSWAATADGGLALIAYAPTVVNALLGGRQVQITEDTAYPFEEQVRLSISLSHSLAFPLVLRIPGWCAKATVAITGKPQAGPAPGSFFRINCTWADGDVIVLRLPMSVKTRTGPSRAVAIQRGPLLYSLRVGENRSVRTPDPTGLGFDEFEI